ncbi:Sugar phosphate permease [Faunimonas pinastri]|uniref:Sugar phosphate permease n=1 Tax=Faunimonas pinastri TaxID=1855383 RepID=A0A1H9EED6_9HYPH|nr:MFS transporter [Faunimonas pinastri]SEQ24084.1 Sugar phosphate permease [Faunimonas pinastri]
MSIDIHAPVGALNSVSPSAAVPARPRGRNLRWLVIGVITLVVISNYLDRGNLSVAAPLIVRDLGISNTAMGVVLSAFVWPYALMNLPTGWMVDRFGPKLLLSIAVGLWSLVSVLTGFANTTAHFLGLRVALGISEAPLFPGALKATNAWFPRHEKAAATSVYIAATQIGLALSPPIATALMVPFGWPAMFVIIGLIGALALIGWLIVYREPGNHPWISSEELTYIRAGQDFEADAVQSKAPVGFREWAVLFRQPSIWTMIIGAFCLQYVFWFYISWLPTYLERAQHVTISHAGYLASLPFIAGAVGVMSGGRFSDWLVERGVAAFTARRAVVSAGGLLTAATMLATAFSANATMAITLLTLGMFTYSLSSGCYWALATDVLETPRFVASVGSIQNFGGFLGGACAPIVTGMIVDYVGGFEVAILVTGGLALVSSVMYGVVLRRRVAL